MPARSVSEILPRRFDALTLADVAEIIGRIGDPRETLFFERKQQLGNPAIAKSCSAFANTYGGLLLVGIRDETNDLVGIPAVAEPQVWVKDVLRGNVLPLPAFQARALQLEDDPGRCVLLVLVAESSTTPHLLTTNGAIYVRNPGSSDPVPIKDQARLLDLTRRGIEARDRAARRAKEITAVRRFVPVTPFHFALVPTGSQHDVVQLLYRDAGLREHLERVLLAREYDFHPDRIRVVGPVSTWGQASVALQNLIYRDVPMIPQATVAGLIVESDCAIYMQRGYHPGQADGPPEPAGPGPINVERELLPWFADALTRSHGLALELGGHGDFRVRVFLEIADRTIMYGQHAGQRAPSNFEFEQWVPFERGAEDDEVLAAELHDALLRWLGVFPR